MVMIETLKQELVISLKFVPSNYGSNGKDENVVVDVKKTVSYPWMKERRTQKKPVVEVSEEDVEIF